MMRSTLGKLLRHESASGVLLVAMASLAMLLANGPLSRVYAQFLDMPVQILVGEVGLSKPLLLWINDGLMAVFFFLVGLEIKREVLQGHLSSARRVILPGAAAIAGIAAPASIYWYFNRLDPIAVRGWAIPSATDIAFALGVFSLFGNRLPLPLKLFLLSVAIFDDLGAIVIIALFYSTDLSLLSLAVAGTGMAVLLILNRSSVNNTSAYVVVGAAVWVAVLKSGVHATLAGFAIACFIPLKLRSPDGHPMLPHLEHQLHPWVNLVILPLFAFANAGVALSADSLGMLSASVPLGIAAGLFLGKQLGVFGVCWVLIRVGLAQLPEGVSWFQLYAVSVLCGIGLTMSLFVGTLAFEGQGAIFQTQVKLGVIVGSLLSATLASILIRFSPARRESKEVAA